MEVSKFSNTLGKNRGRISILSLFHLASPGGGVLPYVTLTGTYGPIGYGFQGVLS